LGDWTCGAPHPKAQAQIEKKVEKEVEKKVEKTSA
jgi:hypothetical protein